MDPFNFADALLGVVAQRLARRVCDACGVVEPAGDEELEALAQEYCADSKIPVQSAIEAWAKRLGGKVMLRRPAGCIECGQTGYRGRNGLYELFFID